MRFPRPIIPGDHPAVPRTHGSSGSKLTGGCRQLLGRKATEAGGRLKRSQQNIHREWVSDCYKISYASAPSDGTAASDVAGCLRVLRGGSWSYGPRNLRAASRIGFTPDARNDGVGFRVARTLDPSVLKR